MQHIFKSEFPTFSAAETELHSAAKAASFSLLVMTKKPNATAPRRAVFRCCKGRKYASQSAEGVHVTKKRKTRTQMTECPFKIALKLVRGSGGGEVWEKAEAEMSCDLPIRESQIPDREGQPHAQPIKSTDPAPATDTTAAAAAVEAAILRAASQPQSNPPPSTAPAAINISKESTTTLGLKRLEAGDSYEPGTELHRSYMRAFQRLEDASDDEGSDAASGAGDAVAAQPPKEIPSLTEKNITDAFTQFSRWSNTDAPGKSFYPGFEECMYRLAQEIEAGGHDDIFDDNISDFSDVTDDLELPDSGPSIEVLGG